MRNANKIKIDSVFREKLELLCGNHITISSNNDPKNKIKKEKVIKKENVNNSKNNIPPPPPPPPLPTNTIISSQSPPKIKLSNYVNNDTNMDNESCVLNESINTIQTNNIECINCYRSRVSYYNTRQKIHNKLDLLAESIIDYNRNNLIENNTFKQENYDYINKLLTNHKDKLQYNNNIILCVMGIFIGIMTVFTSKIIL